MGPPALQAVMEQTVLTRAPTDLAERIAGVAVSAAATAEVTGRERGSWLGSLIGMVNSGSALGLAAAVVIGGALAWSFRTNAKLEAEITRLRGESQVIAGLQRENRRMAQLVREVEELRREVVELPALRSAVRPTEPPPAAGAVSVTVTPEGNIRWENEDVTPADFLARLQAFRARYPALDSSVFVRAGGAALSTVTYVVNESRKAGIKQILVEGESRPDAGGWF
jgi:biopolymer transport protein ExbD